MEAVEAERAVARSGVATEGEVETGSGVASTVASLAVAVREVATVAATAAAGARAAVVVPMVVGAARAATKEGPPGTLAERRVAVASMERGRAHQRGTRELARGCRRRQRG